ncbi:DUF305 domain-containing protein [Deinococcus radiomollis]|uniref:DUF305 domain-containing protein n=1 Tax=Deinococcus radiomollis TaxID=468916 RepID=UPI0038920ABD
MKSNAETYEWNAGQSLRPKRSVLFLIAGLIALLAVGQGQASMSMPGMNMDDAAVTRLRGLKGQAFDVAWSKAMLDHHAAAVAMARTEVRQGRNTQIKKAATAVIADQTREITLMQSWLKAWKQPIYTPAVKMMAPATGISADRWFLSEMIPHHRGAVAMSRLTPGRSQNAAVKALSLQIIAAQSKEILQYRAWLKTVR